MPTIQLQKSKIYKSWLIALKEQIQQSQIKAAIVVNKELLSLYWELGKEICEKETTSNWVRSRHTGWSMPSSRARRSLISWCCGLCWRVTESTCPSPLTSRFARRPTRCGWLGRGRRTSSWSRSRRWAGCVGRWRSWVIVGCPRWCRRRWTRRWAWRPGWRWQRRCPNCPGRVGWGRWRCLRVTSWLIRRCSTGESCRCRPSRRRLMKPWWCGGRPSRSGWRGGPNGWRRHTRTCWPESAG
jgi:hypothetical protein